MKTLLFAIVAMFGLVGSVSAEYLSPQEQARLIAKNGQDVEMRKAFDASSDTQWVYKAPPTSDALVPEKKAFSVQLNSSKNIAAIVEGYCNSQKFFASGNNGTSTTATLNVVSFDVLITDEKGQPTVNVKLNPYFPTAPVSFSVNGIIGTYYLSHLDYVNRFTVLDVFDGGSTTFNAADPLRVDPRNIWGEKIQFDTDQGNIVVTIPIDDPSIQELFKACFGNQS